MIIMCYDTGLLRASHFHNPKNNCNPLIFFLK